MRCYFITPTVKNLLKSYFQQRYFIVESNLKRSKPFKVITRSLPQGSKLGPILFNILTATLIYQLRKYQLEAMLSFYSDDVALLGNRETELILMIKICESFARSIGMEFSCKKSKILVINRLNKAFSTLPKFNLKDGTIPYTQKVRLLGYNTNEEYDGTVQTSHVKKIISNNFHHLRNFIMNYPNESVDYRIYLFKSFVESLTNFCNVQLLNTKNFESLNILYSKYLRQLTTYQNYDEQTRCMSHAVSRQLLLVENNLCDLKTRVQVATLATIYKHLTNTSIIPTFKKLFDKIERRNREGDIYYSYRINNTYAGLEQSKLGPIRQMYLYARAENDFLLNKKEELKRDMTENDVKQYLVHEYRELVVVQPEQLKYASITNHTQ